MSENQALFPVATMCRVLGVSTSGYYAWQGRGLSKRAQRDAALKSQIERIHRRSDGTYGAPRIQDDLKELGERVSRKRIARLLRELGLQGVTRRKGVWTTRRDPEAVAAPDLVDRDFTAAGPNQLWVADITYVPTREGFLYLAVVLDAWSRRVVGWAMAPDLRTALVLDALNMALTQRRPTSVLHHSDRGCQYTSLSFGDHCRRAGVQLSMGSSGDCYDNALCESFFATLECEHIARRRFHTRAQAQCSIFRYIEGWYNPHRRHSSIGRMSPINFERMQRAA